MRGHHRFRKLMQFQWLNPRHWMKKMRQTKPKATDKRKAYPEPSFRDLMRYGIDQLELCLI
jgi:hypothetical protein